MKENYKYQCIPRFHSELWGQNKNAKLVEFLEKINSGQEKVSRAISFLMKLIVKPFNLEKIVKIREKRGLLE